MAWLQLPFYRQGIACGGRLMLLCTPRACHGWHADRPCSLRAAGQVWQALGVQRASCQLCQASHHTLASRGVWLDLVSSPACGTSMKSTTETLQRENWQLRQHLLDLRRAARHSGVNLTAGQALLTFPEVEALLDGNSTSIGELSFRASSLASRGELCLRLVPLYASCMGACMGKGLFLSQLPAVLSRVQSGAAAWCVGWSAPCAALILLFLQTVGAGLEALSWSGSRYSLSYTCNCRI